MVGGRSGVEKSGGGGGGCGAIGDVADRSVHRCVFRIFSVCSLATEQYSMKNGSAFSNNCLPSSTPKQCCSLCGMYVPACGALTSHCLSIPDPERMCRETIPYLDRQHT